MKKVLIGIIATFCLLIFIGLAFKSKPKTTPQSYDEMFIELRDLKTATFLNKNFIGDFKRKELESGLVKITNSLKNISLSYDYNDELKTINKLNIRFEENREIELNRNEGDHIMLVQNGSNLFIAFNSSKNKKLKGSIRLN
ncbi:MAG: hypothetical protein CMO01_28710 [Thalassobius sp.]|nr:hypothetical protein [Thalassovita sp.]